MKKTYLLYAILLILFSACKKDLPDFSEYEEIPVTTIGNYQPTTKGSYWKYASSGDGQDPDTTITTMLGTSVGFDGKLYKAASNEITSEDEIGSVNFYKTGNSYSIRELSEQDTTELLYLKSDADIGATWNADLLNPSTEAKAVGKMMEKGITKVIFGKTFTNVMHTQLDLQVKESSGAFVTAATVDFYIAKDIGVIEEDVSILGITAKAQLYEYSIK